VRIPYVTYLDREGNTRPCGGGDTRCVGKFLNIDWYTELGDPMGDIRVGAFGGLMAHILGVALILRAGLLLIDAKFDDR